MLVLVCCDIQVGRNHCCRACACYVHLLMNLCLSRWLLPRLCLSYAVTLMLVLLLCYGTLACHVRFLRCLYMLCSFATTPVLVCCNAHACRNHLLCSCRACFFCGSFFLSCLFTAALIPVLLVCLFAHRCHARLLQRSCLSRSFAVMVVLLCCNAYACLAPLLRNSCLSCSFFAVFIHVVLICHNTCAGLLQCSCLS